MNLIELVKRRINLNQNMIDSDLDNLLKLACNEMSVNVEIVDTKCRKRELVDARFIYFYLAKILTNKPLNTIGAVVKRDHSTVIHGLKEVENLKILKNKVDNILRLFNYENNTQ